MKYFKGDYIHRELAYQMMDRRPDMGSGYVFDISKADPFVRLGVFPGIGG